MTIKKFKFTKTAFEKLSAPGYYYDTEVRGFCIRINKNRSITYYVYRRFRVGTGFESKPQRVKLGFFPELPIEEARKRAEEINAEAARNDHPLRLQRAYRKSPTLAELLQAYIEQHIKKKRKCITETERMFLRWFGDWMNRKAMSITREDVEVRHSEIGETRGKYAANRALELMRAIFNKALDWELIEGRNPAAKISQFAEFSRERVLREDELEGFKQAIESEPNADLRDFIMLALYTGQRKANVLGMRWADIDFEGHTWRIPGEVMKNGQALTLALTERELEILRRRNQNGEYVFPGTGKTGHFVEPKKGWKKLLERAGIEDLHIHDLRRSLASYMASTGANVALIKNALNHKDIQTTLNVYARTAKDAERKARDRAHEHMFGAQNKPIVTSTNIVSFAERHARKQKKD